MGGLCNQQCSFCHSNKKDIYKYNPKILEFLIKDKNYNRIDFGGGEPLIYLNRISYMAEKIRTKNPYKKFSLLTNGSLIDIKAFQFIIKYATFFAISINQFTNLSKENIFWIRRIPHVGVSSVYDGSMSLDDMDKRLHEYEILFHKRLGKSYNLMHTTDINTKGYTKQQVDEYITGMEYRISQAIKDYLNNKNIDGLNYTNILMDLIERYYIKSRVRRQGCYSDSFIQVALDGRIMECSYDNLFVKKSDEYQYIWDLDVRDIAKFNYYKKQCYSCPMNNHCRVCTISKLRETECSIYRELYYYTDNLLKKYGINPYDIERKYYARSPR